LRRTYTLLLLCKRSFKRSIGRRGQIEIRKGYYLYTGSAMGTGAVSLEQRVARHRRRSKPMRWHVDYLTGRREIGVVNVICVTSERRLECQINQRIMSEFSVKPIFPRAGASDCNCAGHLLFVELADSNSIMKRLNCVYASYGKPSFV